MFEIIPVISERGHVVLYLLLSIPLVWWKWHWIYQPCRRQYRTTDFIVEEQHNTGVFKVYIKMSLFWIIRWRYHERNCGTLEDARDVIKEMILATRKETTVHHIDFEEFEPSP